tara:strand:+ start:277 stop:666 length:390 start_codon:yes stop_codon:yes gene_type:complete
MKIVCRYVTGEYLEDGYLLAGYTPRSKFALRQGVEYVVNGMCMMYPGVLLYLVQPLAGQFPSWCPASLFEIADPQLPQDWCFSFRKIGNVGSVHAVWGYERLVCDEEHFDGLSEGNSVDFQYFSKITNS